MRCPSAKKGGEIDGEPFTDSEDQEEEVEQEEREEGEEEPQSEVDEPQEPKQTVLRKPAASAKYFFGYSEEQEMAWRRPHDKKKGAEEYTRDLTPQDNDFDPVIARWDDGMEHPIEGLLSLTHRTRQEADASQKGAKGIRVHWSGRTASGSPIVVKDNMRGDLPPLVAMYVSGKQRVQLVVDDVSAPHSIAIKVMIETAQRQAAVAELFERKELQDMRDALLIEHGVGKKTRAPLKRSFSEIFSCSPKKKPPAASSASLLPDEPPAKQLQEKPPNPVATRLTGKTAAEPAKDKTTAKTAEDKTEVGGVGAAGVSQRWNPPSPELGLFEQFDIM